MGCLAVAACSDRTLTTDPAGETTMEPERPEAGEMFAECRAHDDCRPLPYCVFPEDEAGFCTRPCTNGLPDTCESPGSGSAALDCLDVGSGQPVCALDCAKGSCPFEMVCQDVATPDGERRICF